MTCVQDINAWSVYIHTNKVNGKKYVGITSRTPEVRWQNGVAYKRNIHFFSAIEKYEWDAFKHTVLHRGLQKDEAAELEKKYIKLFHTKDRRYGYNYTDGGEGVMGYSHTEEYR